MCHKIGPATAQLQPILVEIKRGWQRLKVTKDIKQDFLANRCGVDKSQVSRWLNPEEHEFPSWAKLGLLIEAMQEWPGVMHHEPLEELNKYFGCRAADITPTSAAIEKLAGLLSTNTGKALALIIEATSPGSDGGREITPAEAAEVGPCIHLLRHVICDMDDRLNGGAK